MSGDDDAAAKRAAAAEARRQKILARGAERLNRITVGTPIASSQDGPEALGPDASVLHSPKPELGHTEGDIDPPEIGSAPDLRLRWEQPITEAPSEGFTSAQGAGSSEPRQPEDAEALHAAQREAEQALHALLNQLAGPAAGQLFPSAQLQNQILSQMRSGVPAAGMDAAPSTPGRTAAATVPPPLQSASRGEDRHGYDGRAAVGGTGTSGAGGTAAAIGLAFVTVLSALLGPQLTAAVEATRRIRCAAAVALAVVLYLGVVDVGHLRGLPPVVVLLATQAAVIAAARMLGVFRPLTRVRSYKQLGGGLDSVDSAGDGSAAVDAGGSAAKDPVGPAGALLSGSLKGDWLAFVPGLRPLIDRVSSAGALLTGLYGDVAVFLVSYIVLGALGQLAGRAGAGDTGSSGSQP